jgi:uncharacterized membrane protein YraQ (UPF0718 family)/copper chaperone CopZ
MLFLEIFETIFRLFIEMAPYMILGLIFVGLLNLLFTKELIIKHIGKNDFTSIIKAALFGVPLPLCSCGVIPSAVYMSKNGASKPAVVSFLISTPQTGIDSMIATYGMLGPVMAIFRPVAALIMGIAGGLAVKISGLTNETLAAKSIQAEELSIGDDQKGWQRFYNKLIKYPFTEFLDDISSQFIVGLIIAGLITFLIPEDFFSGSIISKGIPGMLLLIAIGIPMYVCATASIPIAISLIMKGFSPGVAFVFLAAGPATNMASIAVLTKVLGNKTTAVYILVISVLSIAFGLILDWIFVIGGFNIHAQMTHIHEHDMNNFSIFQWIISGIFLILLFLSVYRKHIRPRISRLKKMEDTKTRVNISGMTCNHCAMNVQKAIMKTEGIENAEISLPDNAAFIEGKFDFEQLKKNIEDVGYKVL